MNFVYATIDGIVQWGSSGACVTLRVGDVWWADDPFVKGRPDLFSATPVVVHGTEGQEPPTPTPLGETKRRGRARG